MYSLIFMIEILFFTFTECTKRSGLDRSLDAINQQNKAQREFTVSVLR
jgi:hypothetical protein